MSLSINDINRLQEENEQLKRQFKIESLTDEKTGKTIYRSQVLLDLQTNCTGCEEYENVFKRLAIKNRDSRIYKNTLEKVFEILSSQVWQIGDDVVVEEARRIIREVLK